VTSGLPREGALDRQRPFARRWVDAPPPSRRSAIVAALFVAAIMAACATPPRGSEGTPLRGRLLIKVAARDGRPAQSHSAAFELSGDERQGQMRLLSPLGTQVALARWRMDGAWLQDAQGTREFRNLPDMAEAALGEPVPLNALLHWLQGEPWPGAAHQGLQSNSPGFVQLGWAVDLGQWAEAALVDARRLDPPGVSVRAKMDRGS
jgi:outer membrane lipoprotein LolB